MTSSEAREQLDAVVREQLTNAWQRGIDTAPHSMAALANPDAGAMFRTVAAAADDYAAAIALRWADQTPVSRETPIPEAET
jgi:hypothetical protein